MSKFKVRATYCPYCHISHDGASDAGINDSVRAPEIGDIYICIQCRLPSILVAESTVRRILTDSEAKDLQKQIREHLT